MRDDHGGSNATTAYETVLRKTVSIFELMLIGLMLTHPCLGVNRSHIYAFLSLSTAQPIFEMERKNNNMRMASSRIAFAMFDNIAEFHRTN